ncbi:MAG TPA: DUF1707 domain-containing protein [Actinomycetes bacterium]|jgi:hypothetical protein|nr:DUF1707 domain-containing protein [Actinomycetes bacterium]
MDLEPDLRRAALRASDADREQIISALRQHHAEGRLTVDEFTERMHRAFGSKTFGELDLLTRDLPPLPPPLPEVPRPDPAMVAKRRFYGHLLSYAWTNAFLVALWALGCLAFGHLMFFWPLWTIFGWGLALGSHAIRAFGPQESGPDHHDGLPRPRRDRRGDRWSRRHGSRSHVYW